MSKPVARPFNRAEMEALTPEELAAKQASGELPPPGALWCDLGIPDEDESD